jgi:hypothetical protein
MQCNVGESGEECSDEEAEHDVGAALRDDGHDAMLQRIVGDKSRARRRTVVLTEALQEGEYNVAAARRADPGGAGSQDGGDLSLEDLLEGSSIRQSDRKLLEKLARGVQVCHLLPRVSVVCAIRTILLLPLVVIPTYTQKVEVYWSWTGTLDSLRVKRSSFVSGLPLYMLPYTRH